MSNKGHALVDRGFLGNEFSLVIQFALAHMCTVTNMQLTGGAVLAECYGIHFVVSPSLGTALL
jgi:hypothetical protein